eukprot:4605504-Pyramimonas_sp.AAC.1
MVRGRLPHAAGSSERRATERPSERPSVDICQDPAPRVATGLARRLRPLCLRLACLPVTVSLAVLRMGASTSQPTTHPY